MKPICFLLLTAILFSCKDDISNKKYRNENYVFYQKEGKKGEWLKINPDLELKLPKSFSTYFFPNGNKYAEIEVIDSFPNRKIKCYDLSERLTHTSIYELDSLIKTTYEDGYFYSYHSNYGLLKSEGFMENNMNQRVWKFYRKNGKTLKQAVGYKNDTLHGIRKDFWKNGQLKSKATNINGKQNGKSSHYYQDGQLEEINFLLNNKAHGKSIRYHPNGELQADCSYWNGIKKDTCKFYYEDGNLKGIQITLLDTISSSYSSEIYNYYSNGNLKQTFKSINGRHNGLVKTYHKNGNLSHKFNLLNNLKEGKTFEYHENGIVRYIGFYKNNVPYGDIKEFDINSQLIKTLKVENGIITDSIMY